VAGRRWRRKAGFRVRFGSRQPVGLSQEGQAVPAVIVELEAAKAAVARLYERWEELEQLREGEAP
jgi:hypothetical protein